MTDPRAVTSTTLSRAWLQTVLAINDLPSRSAVHVTTRILDPTLEESPIRQACDELLETLGLPSAERVANTLFPHAAAERIGDPARLAEHYRGIYPRIKKFRPNASGTYFGRLVEQSDGAVDQLTLLVEKLGNATGEGQALGSRYELNIYDHSRDGHRRMGFPCLSFVSFHLDDSRLHACGVYRNHYLVERAYGNYLALSRLQAYIASAVGIQSGELLVIAGHAEVDHAGKRDLAKRLAGLLQ